MSYLKMYILVTLGILALCHFSGVIPSDGEEGSELFRYMFNPQKIQDLKIGDLVGSTIKENLAAIGLGAIAIGAAIALSKPELILFAPLALFFQNLFLDLLVIYEKLESLGGVGYMFGVLFIAIPTILFFVVIIDWWRGRD
jgi:hypothetical protein